MIGLFRRRGNGLIWAGLVLLVLALIPRVVSSPYFLHVLIIAAIYAVYAASWDLLSGYTGQLSLGHALFFGVSAYTAALLNTRLDVSPWLSLPAGAAVAVLIGLLVGLPCLRLRGPYLGIVTLAFAEIAFSLAWALSDISGGEEGIIRIDSLVYGPTSTKYYATLVFLVLGLGALYALTRSDFGLTLLAIREDEAASEAAGVDTTRYKLWAFLVSAGFAGLAGGYYTHYMKVVNPDILEIPLSAAAIAFTLVGGLGTIVGPAVGAFLLTIIFQEFSFLVDVRVLAYNVLLILVVLFLPRGLYGTLRAKLRGGPTQEPVVYRWLRPVRGLLTTRGNNPKP